MAKQITDREKLLLVTAAMGQNVSNAQATTLTAFDTISSDAESITFFEGCNTRDFPATNLTSNKLPYKNNLVVDTITFNVLNIDGGGTDWQETELYLSESYFTLTIGSQDVLKKIPLALLNIMVAQQPFATTTDDYVFVPRTKLVIPADTSFKIVLENTNPWRFPGQAMKQRGNYRCTLKGFGTIKGGTTY